ncbi:hypothetical protein ACFVHS_35410 [Streptomyces sp. NPDC057746]|uniref:hypothetical protein n=1 Tax=Streptomyces sp. NPDC057746 TaxID=3346237 RepID=UPI0036BCA723
MVRAGPTGERVPIAGAEPADEAALDRATMSQVARRSAFGVRRSAFGVRREGCRLYAYARGLEDLRDGSPFSQRTEKTIQLPYSTFHNFVALEAAGGFARKRSPQQSRERTLDALHNLLEHWPSSREGDAS